MLRIRWTTLTLCLALGGAAHAEEREAAALASRLMRKHMPRAQFDRMMQMMVGQMQEAMEQQAAASGTAVPPDFAARIATAVHEMVPYDEMMDTAAGVWMKHFTVAELKDLLKFYDSPVGKKLVDKQPEIAQDSMGVMMPMIQSRMPRIMEKLKASAPQPQAKGK